MQRILLRLLMSLGLMVVVGGMRAFPPAYAAGNTTFKFSGAVKGTLSSSNQSCSQVGAYGGQFEFFTTLKGSGN